MRAAYGKSNIYCRILGRMKEKQCECWCECGVNNAAFVIAFTFTMFIVVVFLCFPITNITNKHKLFYCVEGSPRKMFFILLSFPSFLYFLGFHFVQVLILLALVSILESDAFVACAVVLGCWFLVSSFLVVSFSFCVYVYLHQFIALNFLLGFVPSKWTE